MDNAIPIPQEHSDISIGQSVDQNTLIPYLVISLTRLLGTDPVGVQRVDVQLREKVSSTLQGYQDAPADKRGAYHFTFVDLLGKLLASPVEPLRVTAYISPSLAFQVSQNILVNAERANSKALLARSDALLKQFFVQLYGTRMGEAQIKFAQFQAFREQVATASQQMSQASLLEQEIANAVERKHDTEGGQAEELAQ